MAPSPRKQSDEKIIAFNSEEAAQYKSISGWVSRDGYFYAEDEHTARYAGCTHVECNDCKKLIPKTSTACDDCHKKQLDHEFSLLPRTPWDRQTPLVIFNTDIYFFDEDHLNYYCAEKQLAPQDLQLVFCIPLYPPLFDASDYLADILPEDGEVPDEIAAAAEIFNQALKASEPISWIEGNIAADLSTT